MKNKKVLFWTMAHMVMVILMFGQTQSKESVIASNEAIFEYDSLFNIYKNSVLTEIQSKASLKNIAHSEAAEEVEIPASLFLDLSKSYMQTNLLHRTVNKSGDMDLYSKGGEGWLIRQRIWRDFPEPWKTFTRIDGYVLVKILEDNPATKSRDFKIAYCEVYDDLLGNVNESHIFVKHIGDWSKLIDIDQTSDFILLEISRGSQMVLEDGKVEEIYYSRSGESWMSKYCIVQDGRIQDDYQMLYQEFSSYEDFKSVIASFLNQITSNR